MMPDNISSDILSLANIMKILGDPNRLHITLLISRQELCVCELTAILGLSQSNVSQHLAKLKSSGIVKERRQAQWVYYSLNQEKFPIIKNIINTLPDISFELLKLNGLQEHLKCKK